MEGQCRRRPKPNPTEGKARLLIIVDMDGYLFESDFVVPIFYATNQRNWLSVSVPVSCHFGFSLYFYPFFGGT